MRKMTIDKVHALAMLAGGLLAFVLGGPVAASAGEAAAGAPAAEKHAKNPDLAAMKPGTWLPWVKFKTGAGILAYSGWAYDDTHHSMLLFGGGHGDGNQNHVIKLDIAKGEWSYMYKSDPPKEIYTRENSGCSAGWARGEPSGTATRTEAS